MVDVRVGQLRRSRDRLERRGEQAVGDGDQATAGLMLFYSAECGLKAEVMDQRNVRDTSQLEPRLRNHNLRALAKELRLSGQAQAALVPCRRSDWQDAAAQNQVSHMDLHQAWRYGADLDPEQEKQALRALRALIVGSRK